MTVKQVDLLNIALMAVSCAVAFIIPFELFLFAYAVLGPLHYLTEISWLHKRRYFTRGKYDFMLLVALCFLALLGSYFNDLLTFLHIGIPQFLVDLRMTLRANYIGTHAIYIAFLSALVMILIKDYMIKALAVAFIIFTAFLLHGTTDNSNSLSNYIIYFGIFLPTIIHVYFFTAAFMLSGALKNRSKTGLASLGMLASCTALFFLIPAGGLATVSHYVENSYNNAQAGFSGINIYLMKFLGMKEMPTEYDVFHSGAGVQIMRFIAFAYTYHYLNWFSKTSIIKWHEVPKLQLAVVAAIWMLSLYAYYGINYTTGLKWLYFLSMLHVFLEFPLNFQSFKLIGKDLRGWMTAVPAK